MAKTYPSTTETVIHDPKTGKDIIVRGLGAMKGLDLQKGIDLTKPIAAQVFKSRKTKQTGQAQPKQP